MILAGIGTQRVNQFGGGGVHAIIVVNPFGDIARHVKQAVGIGTETAHGGWSAEIVVVAAKGVGHHILCRDVRIVSVDAGRWHDITPGKTRRFGAGSITPGPGPLRFRRQPVTCGHGDNTLPAAILLGIGQGQAVLLAEPVAKPHRIIPVQVDHGPVIAREHRSTEDTGIMLAVELLILVVGDLMNTHVKGAGQFHLFLNLVGTPARFATLCAHGKLTG